uniref:Uncharacterized protein n=1 Tax=Thaumatella adunca TaxID=2006976 RepID=A0A1Z1MNS7_9FLOR|nr:hypothetical protein [Thaumatella adunca]ARW67414.1 hypothetical protein [Thaumatella adunca]
MQLFDENIMINLYLKITKYRKTNICKLNTNMSDTL